MKGLKTFAFICISSELLPGASPADALRRKALECARLKNWACAIDNYRQAIRVEPDAETHYNLALALKYAGKPEEAVPEFESALKMKPDWAAAEYGLGASLYALHKNRAAIEALQRAIK